VSEPPLDLHALAAESIAWLDGGVGHSVVDSEPDDDGDTAPDTPS